MPGEITGPESVSSTVPPSDPNGTSRVELPVLSVEVVRERADAARNRLRVLAAAERLFAQRGVDGVTMDKGGLAVALLDQRERELQQQILTGPPPLGPGTGPARRLAAFITSYLVFLDGQLELVLLSETSTPGARLRTGAHGFWRQHCRYLLGQAGAPQADLRADLLLAGLAADQVRHWLHDQHHDLHELADALSAAALALAQPHP